jgi:hypothetical protein
MDYETTQAIDRLREAILRLTARVQDVEATLVELVERTDHNAEVLNDIDPAKRAV